MPHAACTVSMQVHTLSKHHLRLATDTMEAMTFIKMNQSLAPTAQDLLSTVAAASTSTNATEGGNHVTATRAATSMVPTANFSDQDD